MTYNIRIIECNIHKEEITDMEIQPDRTVILLPDIRYQSLTFSCPEKLLYSDSRRWEMLTLVSALKV